MAALRPTAIRAIAAQRGAFRPSGPVRAIKPEFQPHIGRLAPENAVKWLPALAMWGAAAGGAVALFMSNVPIFQADVLKKIPFFDKYYEDTTPDSDKPF